MKQTSRCIHKKASLPRHVSGLKINADHMDFSGLANEPFLGDDLNAMSDAMDAHLTEIEPNAMEAVAAGGFHRDVMGADTSQRDAMEANVIDADTFDGDAYDGEDFFEQDLLDAEASETGSQGKKLPSLQKFAGQQLINRIRQYESFIQPD
jgi:hypothetical protein